jgi:hypothetical protein
LADERDIAQIELLNDCGEIICQYVEVIAGRRFSRWSTGPGGRG